MSASVRQRLARRRYRRLQRRLLGPRVFAAFAESHPEAVFVEIGANDGEQHDFLRPHVAARRWTGLMVEPVPYVFERLRANYDDVPGVTLVNAAVAGQDGVLPFFHLRDAPPEERAALPDWYDGIGSFNRDVILSHAPQMPDIAERIVEHRVEALSFDTLLARHGLAHVDLVVVDTEGYDWEILRHIDFSRHRPRMVVYEHFHLARGDREAARGHLEAAGYQTIEEGFDTFCVRPGAGDALDRLWRGARPAVPGVSKDDEAR